MKILQINAVHRKLSTGRNVAELNHYFEAQGHKTFTAFSTGEIKDSEREYLIGSKTGQKIHAVLSRLTGLQGYYSAGATKKLLQYMDSQRPDVVILNNLHANYIHVPKLLQYLAEKDIPTIAVLHDCWFYTGKCCYYTVQGCNKWKDSCKQCPAVKQYNKSWFFDRADKMLRDKKAAFNAIPRLGIVAVSDWMLQEAKQAPSFNNAVEFTRIYNWIDTQLFCPSDTKELREKLNLTDKKVLLGVAAMWDQRKGIDSLLQMAEQMQENEILVLVGKMPENVILPQNVLPIQKTDSCEELAAYYAMADVFLQPSLEETFGKVTAEALCCGTPVVCFDSTANPELVGPGCGEVVEPGNAQAMLEAARSIANRDKSVYTEACRAFAAEHFEMKKNTQQYLDFCLRLVQAKTRR